MIFATSLRPRSGAASILSITGLNESGRRQIVGPLLRLEDGTVLLVEGVPAQCRHLRRDLGVI